MKYTSIITLTIITTIIIIFYKYNNTIKSKYTIAIIQSASHPALDAAKDGFIEVINQSFLKNQVEFLLYNTQGSLSQAHGLASQLYQNKKINMFYTIGSSVTQAISKIEKNRPILFSAVSDYKTIGIDESSKNITGISDMISPEIPVYLINTIYPNANKIGLFYSLSTLNQKECLKIREALEKNNKNVTEIIINNENEIESILESNINQIDALLSPCDNIIASAMPLIVKKTLIHKKPFFVCFNEATQAGALASCGTNYYESGKNIAFHAIKIIKKEINITDIQIEISKDDTIYLNQKTAKIIDMHIPTNNKNIILI